MPNDARRGEKNFGRLIRGAKILEDIRKLKGAKNLKICHLDLLIFSNVPKTRFYFFSFVLPGALILYT